MIEGFSMERFISLLDTRKDQIEEQIYDLLLSFSDFESFKEMMLFARAHLVATTPKPVSSKAASASGNVKIVSVDLQEMAAIDGVTIFATRIETFCQVDVLLI